TILDRHQNQHTSVTLCLAPGTYILNAPLRLTSAHSHITLEACQKGSVRLEADNSTLDAFTDGLVVVTSAQIVAFCGIEFRLPASHYRPADGKFADLPLDALMPDVHTTLASLIASIGLRAVNCSGLTVTDCTFTFPQFRDNLSLARSIPFGVG